MKFYDEKSEKVESSGLGQTSQFTIEANMKAFMTLSSTLYSNKIRAIVRELGTNAYDAHVEANQSKPFKVKIPTTFDTEFTIRDFGTGLSHNDCMNLYTTYFKSTRDNRNDVVGGFGLGSKSFMGYSDSATVISYHHGKKRTYTAYKDDYGTPQFSHLSTVDTTEPNGLEIKFDVKRQDIRSFETEAQYVYSFFPSGSVDCNIEIYPQTYDEKTDDYGIPSTYNHGHYVIMGNVAYPVDYDKIEDESIREATKYFRSLHIFVDIGDVGITPSREALSYDKRTIQTLNKKISRVFDKMASELRKKIDSCACLFDARVLFCASAMPNLVKAKCRYYKKQEIFPNPKDRSIDISNFIKSLGSNSKIELVSNANYTWNRADNDITSINIANNPSFWLDDTSRGGLTPLRGVYGRYYTTSTYYLKLEPKEVDTFCKLMGFPKEYLKSIENDLDRPVTTTRVQNPVEHRLQAFVWKPDPYTHTNKDCWSEQDVDLNKGGYYFEVKNHNIVVPGTDEVVKSTDFRNTLDLARKLGIVDQDEIIYGLKTASINRKTIFPKDKWTNYYSYLKKRIEETVTRYKDDIALFNANGPYRSKYDEYLSLGNHWIVDHVTKWKNITGYARSYTKLCNEFSIPIPTTTQIKKKIVDKYKLVDQVYSITPEVLEYIKLVDNCKKGN